MKVFVALSCLLAVASAGLVVSPHSVLIQPQHLPIIDSNGVPVEPLVNQVARAQHAELRLAAQLRNGDAALVGAPLALAAASPVAVAHSAPLAVAAHSTILAAPQHLPVIDANGVPVEPLENQIARAQNAAAHINAHARNGDLAILGRKKRGIIAPLAYAAPQHLPLIDSNGVPVEPLVNQVARAQHAELRLAAQLRNGDAALVASPIALAAAPSPLALAAHGAVLAAPQHLPVLDANGVPVEPLANQIARAQNAAAHINAHARNGDAIAILGRKKRGIIAPLAYAAPQHLPIIDSNGVPVEPLVNQVARAQHAELHLAAQLRNGDAALVGAPVALAAGPVAVAHSVPIAVAHSAPLTVAHAAPLAVAHSVAVPASITSVSHVGRVPLDTPEVAAAKAAHLATKSGLIL
ncbi:uncharacterized protein LOC123302062 [Chrysoperla carnea]|uniref:uncharacterized protein LOC123301539 n=1 Tax=Chrysoperla carnea TaxID=189513 RepID=UPI001D086C3F|nr:uncharacterized protein LOC123301539 [Chrysoperla carnea]XP_044740787.1 uncharacterized protein LOC123302062 [Chrysoperla carnea]